MTRKIAPHLQRVMIVDPNASSAKLLAELLRDIGGHRISVQPGNLAAMAALPRVDPQIIFTELNGPSLDGLALTREIRRSALPCRYAPVIMVSAISTAPAILGARQAGVHEFLRKPYAINDLLRRLDASVLRHRDWIEGVNYVGPDRRRFNSGDYDGPLNRRWSGAQTPHTERLTRALQILRSALGALEVDPTQSIRAMQAQVAELRRAAAGMSSDPLGAAAFALKQRLDAVADGRAAAESLKEAVEPLWRFMPKEPRKAS